MDLESLRNHVIVIGYGPAGRFQAALLKRHSVPFVVVEMNPATIRIFKREGTPYVIGDCSRAEILEHVCVSEARLVIIAISDDEILDRTITRIQEQAPKAVIVVRTRYLARAEEVGPRVRLAVPSDVAAGLVMQQEVARLLNLTASSAGGMEAFRGDLRQLPTVGNKNRA